MSVTVYNWSSSFPFYQRMIALYRLCRSDSVFVISQVTVVTQIKTKSEPASTQIVVLYDGQCNFCTGQVKNLERLDGRGRLRFISLHDPVVARDYPDLSFQQLMDQMWVVAYDGRKYGGADAIRYLSRQLPMLWPLAPLMHVPGTMPIWRYLYRQIAKRRYKIAGRNCDEGGTCSLHQ